MDQTRVIRVVVGVDLSELLDLERLRSVASEHGFLVTQVDEVEEKQASLSFGELVTVVVDEGAIRSLQARRVDDLA